MSGLQVVWFKKDLRTIDHAALSQASRSGPVLPLFIVEPMLWAQPDASALGIPPGSIPSSLGKAAESAQTG